jgi:hypothetical protein
MAKAADRIVELFQTLPARKQLALAHPLSPSARRVSFFDEMTAEQRLELDDVLSEVERGRTGPAEDAIDDLAERFGFAGA